MSSMRLVVFDMDGTLYCNNSWLELHRAFGLETAEDQAMLRWYQEGILDYRAWTNLIARIYRARGLGTQTRALEVMQRCTMAPAAQNVVRDLRSYGYEIALLSGGVDLFVENLARRLGITLYRGNHRLIFDDGGRFVDLEMTADDDELFKVECLKSFCLDLGISPAECFCVGDGGNDRGIFTLTRRGILLCPRSKQPPFSDCWKTAEDLCEALALISESSGGSVS